MSVQTEITETVQHNHLTGTLSALIAKSPNLMREVEIFGQLITSVEYVPTDLDKEDDEILGGWDEQVGTCPECFYLRSANGTCDCS